MGGCRGFWGNIGGYLGIMEKNMETTIERLRVM